MFFIVTIPVIILNFGALSMYSMLTLRKFSIDLQKIVWGGGGGGGRAYVSLHALPSLPPICCVHSKCWLCVHIWLAATAIYSCPQILPTAVKISITCFPPMCTVSNSNIEIAISVLIQKFCYYVPIHRFRNILFLCNVFLMQSEIQVKWMKRNYYLESIIDWR